MLLLSGPVAASISGLPLTRPCDEPPLSEVPAASTARYDCLHLGAAWMLLSSRNDESSMEFKRFSIDRIALESVLRSLGTGPQSLKLVKALWNSNIFCIFEVKPSLAFIILKG